MRVLVSSVGTRGDVQPAIALAIGLRARGHEARLAISPNFVAWATSLGFDARPVGIEMRAPRGPMPDAVRAIATDLIGNQFDAIDAAAEGCDAIVGAGVHQYAARSVGERRGLRVEIAAYAPVSLPSSGLSPVAAPGQPWPSTRWDETRAAWNARSLARVNEKRASFGLAPIADVIDHILGDRPWLAADRALAPTEGAMQTGAWIFEDGTPLPDALESFLRAGEPPVYVGLGSMPAPRETARALIDAARASERRVILSRGWAELDADEPDVLAIDDVDHAALFSRVAAVVHHGGAGTTTAAARAGVPQIITPMFGDQFYWGMRIEQLGIGRRAALPSLAEAVHASLVPAVRDRARALAPEIATDGVANAVDALTA